MSHENREKSLLRSVAQRIHDSEIVREAQEIEDRHKDVIEEKAGKAGEQVGRVVYKTEKFVNENEKTIAATVFIASIAVPEIGVAVGASQAALGKEFVVFGRDLNPGERILSLASAFPSERSGIKVVQTVGEVARAIHHASSKK